MLEYRLVLRLLRPKGIKGQMLARPAEDFAVETFDPSLLIGLPVYVVPPLLEGVRQTTIIAADYHQRGLAVTLQAVSDATSAHLLAGHYLLAAVNDIAPDLLVGTDTDAKGCLGMVITDVNMGRIGTIIEEQTGSAQTLWVVQTELDEVLIPAADDLIVAIRDSEVLMNLPEGLLELNRPAARREQDS